MRKSVKVGRLMVQWEGIVSFFRYRRSPPSTRGAPVWADAQWKDQRRFTAWSKSMYDISDGHVYTFLRVQPFSFTWRRRKYGV